MISHLIMSWFKLDKYITENFAKEVFEGAAILANTIETKDVIFVSEKILTLHYPQGIIRYILNKIAFIAVGSAPQFWTN